MLFRTDSSDTYSFFCCLLPVHCLASFPGSPRTERGSLGTRLCTGLTLQKSDSSLLRKHLSKPKFRRATEFSMFQWCSVRLILLHLFTKYHIIV